MKNKPTSSINRNVIAVASLTIIASISGCTGPSVGSLGMGSDSAAIRAGRNREDAVISEAEIQQHRRQRQNVSEEMDLEQKKTGNMLQNVGSITGAVGNFF
jgi:hypothetical protein